MAGGKWETKTDFKTASVVGPTRRAAFYTTLGKVDIFTAPTRVLRYFVGCTNLFMKSPLNFRLFLSKNFFW